MYESAKQIETRGEKWIAENPRAWTRIKELVRRDVALRSYQDLRINFYVETVRDEMFVKVPNSIAAYLARKLEKEVRGARFTKSKSKLDLLMATDAANGGENA